MKGNVSVTLLYTHGSPSGERDTASPGLWAMLRTQASDEEADVYPPGGTYIVVTPVVTVMGCRRPQVVFFSYVSSDRVTLRGSP